MRPIYRRIDRKSSREHARRETFIAWTSSTWAALFVEIADQASVAVKAQSLNKAASHPNALPILTVIFYLARSPHHYDTTISPIPTISPKAHPQIIIRAFGLS